VENCTSVTLLPRGAFRSVAVRVCRDLAGCTRPRRRRQTRPTADAATSTATRIRIVTGTSDPNAGRIVVDPDELDESG
jgi:hypothetical protein